MLVMVDVDIHCMVEGVASSGQLQMLKELEIYLSTSSDRVVTDTIGKVHQ